MSHRDLAKVELHLHLEGGAPPDFIKAMAEEKSVDLSRIFAPDGGMPTAILRISCVFMKRPARF